MTAEQNLNTSTEPHAGIVIDRLTKTYKGGKVKALNGLSLQINPGEAFGIVGPNGAGKTTLFGCLLAFLKCDSGSIRIDGMPPDALQVRRIIGYLPERLNFDSWMSGRDFLEYHHELAEQPAADRRATCDALLTSVALDPAAWALPIKRYSRGMLQRLGFAQAMIGNPKFLLLDEPASGVDPGGVLLLRKLMKDLKNKGVTIVLNSHQLDQVEKLCDRVAFIKAGQVEALDSMQGTALSINRFLVRWNDFENQPSGEELKTLSESCATTILECQPDSATFGVQNPDVIAELLRAMFLRGYPIIHAAPQDNRLERFFTESVSEQKEENL
jgi:ABC-2 type transport system ATP-binding protein